MNVPAYLPPQSPQLQNYRSNTLAPAVIPFILGNPVFEIAMSQKERQDLNFYIEGVVKTNGTSGDSNKVFFQYILDFAKFENSSSYNQKKAQEIGVSGLTLGQIQNIINGNDFANNHNYKTRALNLVKIIKQAIQKPQKTKSALENGKSDLYLNLNSSFEDGNTSYAPGLFDQAERIAQSYRKCKGDVSFDALGSLHSLANEYMKTRNPESSQNSEYLNRIIAIAMPIYQGSTVIGSHYPVALLDGQLSQVVSLSKNPGKATPFLKFLAPGHRNRLHIARNGCEWLTN